MRSLTVLGTCIVLLLLNMWLLLLLLCMLLLLCVLLLLLCMLLLLLLLLCMLLLLLCVLLLGVFMLLLLLLRMLLLLRVLRLGMLLLIIWGLMCWRRMSCSYRMATSMLIISLPAHRIHGSRMRTTIINRSKLISVAGRYLHMGCLCGGSLRMPFVECRLFLLSRPG